MKEISTYKKAKNRIILGINCLADPIRQTLTSKGGNVIIEDNNSVRITNDGVTIANYIESEDSVANSIIQIIRQAAMRTNALVGDGTTTSILLAQSMLLGGFKLLDKGWNPMLLKKELEKAGSILKDYFKTQIHKIIDDNDLTFIANISANNDMEIANNIVKAVLAVGEDGLCVIEDNPSAETEVKIESGFEMESGMFSPLFSNQKNKLEAQYKDVKILITDKRIYYPNEVLAILEPLAQNRITDVVVVAKDFIGQAPNIFLANHIQRKMNILLIKDSDKNINNTDNLEDLAVYLNTKVISDKSGKLTFNINLEDFGTIKGIFSYSNKTVFYNPGSNINLQMRIQSIKNEIEKIKDEKLKEPLKKRLAKMTKGTATIMVGGKTPIEVRERMYRYEDSFNATRSAMSDGYVIGGGLSLWNAFNEAKTALLKEIKPEVVEIIEKTCSAPLKQISENCNINYKTLMSKVANSKGKIGYNTATEKYENLMKSGIIEPYLVLKLSFENALSVASMIISSPFLITTKNDVQIKKEKTTNRI